MKDYKPLYVKMKLQQKLNEFFGKTKIIELENRILNFSNLEEAKSDFKILEEEFADVKNEIEEFVAENTEIISTPTTTPKASNKASSVAKIQLDIIHTPKHNTNNTNYTQSTNNTNSTNRTNDKKSVTPERNKVAKTENNHLKTLKNNIKSNNINSFNLKPVVIDKSKCIKSKNINNNNNINDNNDNNANNNDNNHHNEVKDNPYKFELKIKNCSSDNKEVVKDDAKDNVETIMKKHNCGRKEAMDIYLDNQSQLINNVTKNIYSIDSRKNLSNHSNNKNINKDNRNNRSLDRSLNKSLDTSNDRSIDRSPNRPLDKSLDRLLNKSNDKSFDNKKVWQYTFKTNLKLTTDNIKNEYAINKIPIDKLNFDAEQFYNKNLKWHQDKIDKAKMLKEESELNEVKNCTFTPKISLTSDKSLPRRSETPDEFYIKNLEWKNKIEKHRKEKRIIKEKKEVEECVFTPRLGTKENINTKNNKDSSSNNINRSINNETRNVTEEGNKKDMDYIYKKNIDWLERQKEKRKKLEEEEKRRIQGERNTTESNIENKEIDYFYKKNIEWLEKNKEIKKKLEQEQQQENLRKIEEKKFKRTHGRTNSSLI